MPLTPKQTRFVAEYLVHLNAADAARRAGYSAKTAQAQGSRLLTNVEVMQAVVAAQGQRLAAADLSAARTLEEIRRVAFLDPRRLFGSHGQLRTLAELSPDEAAAVASIEVTRRRGRTDDDDIVVTRVRCWDKVRALELLAKHFALLVDRSEVEVSQDVREIPTADLAARLAHLAKRLGGPVHDPAVGPHGGPTRTGGHRG